MKLSYRPDIDGLRAIAVLAVVFNHAGITYFSGGYIGVDVFFVISGFLITGIISRELSNNEFTIARFYERRIRRILPALTGVLLFTLAVCYLIYDAEKFAAYGKSLSATMLFYSNINFWGEAGYFDTPSQLKPLLHTWSLAVEEQFYILFPLLMFLLHKFAHKSMPWVLSAIALLSFGWAVYEVGKDANSAFYLAHFRAWELMAGALLALGIFPSTKKPLTNHLIGLAGSILILLPIFLYSEDTPFPGLAALPPVLGTALVIYSSTNQPSFAARIFGLSPLVFIGKISYSLYLWHWPLLIFSRYYLIRRMTNIELWTVLLITLIISALSWKIIETPFRGKHNFNTRQIFSLAAVVMVMILLSSAVITRYNGFPTRAGLELIPQTDQKASHWSFKECNINYIDNPEDILTCNIGSKSKQPVFLIWGDSHAPTFGKGISDDAAKNKIAGLITYAQGCPPLIDMIPDPQVGDVSCVDYNYKVINYLERHPEIKTVIIASRLTIWAEGTRYKLEEGQKTVLKDIRKELPRNTKGSVMLKTGLERTIKTLQEMGRQVIIIAPIPEIGFDVPSANFIAARTGRDVNQIIAPSAEEYQLRSQNTFNILNNLSEQYSIQIVEPWKALCIDAICRAAINGIPLYSDDDHLSIFGSEYIAPIFEPVFKNIKQQGNP